MASAQDWNYTLLIYFILVAIVSLVGAGAIQQHKIDFRNANLEQIDSDSHYYMEGGYKPQLQSGNIGNETQVPNYSDGLWDWGTYLKDLFSLLVFNISLTTNDFVLINYWWIFRTLFIQLPLIMVGISIYHSVRRG